MNQISLADYREQIEAAIEDGRYEEAVAHGKHILEHFPKDVGAYWLLGKAMLESGQDTEATDMFQRVLSADPEHMLAWVGMSEIARKQDDLEQAVSFLQHAFELATDNDMVARELRRLYGELQGDEPERLQLTEGALAKLYLRGDLLTRAVSELRKLIEEHPDRLDLKVTLIEALWRNGQRLEAAEICQEILDEQPYNLKANLILGEIWASSGRGAEAEPYLERAEALDPENAMALDLFGSASPLPPREPQIEPLPYEAEAVGERMEWMAKREEQLPVEEDETMAAEIEIPAWLEEIADEPAPEEAAAPVEDVMAQEPEIELPAEELTREEAWPAEKAEEPPSDEEVTEEGVHPEVMAVEEAGPTGFAPEDVEEEDALDWLSELEREEPIPVSSEDQEEEEEEELPAWLAELEAGAEEELTTGAPAFLEQELEAAEIPDWLRDLAPPPSEPGAREAPEGWETLLEEEVREEEEEARAPEAEDLEPADAAAAELERLEAVDEMRGLPSWLESEELPSGDEALAWLAQLAADYEEEEAEPEAEAGPAAELEVEEEEFEQAFGWTAFAPTAEEEEIEEEVPVEETKRAPFPSYPTVEEEEPLSVPTDELAEAAEGTERSGEVQPAAEVAQREEEAVEEPAAAEQPVMAEEVEAAPEADVGEERADEGEIVGPAEPMTPGVAEIAKAGEPEPPSADEIVPPEEKELGEAPPSELELEETLAPEPTTLEAPKPERPEVVPIADEQAKVVEAPEAEVEEPAAVEREMPAPEEPAEREVAEPAPVAEAVPEEVAPAEAVEEAPAEDLDGFIAAQRAYAEEHPEDYNAQLDLARVLWQADMRQDAVAAYEGLLEQGELLDAVIEDLEDYSAQEPDAALMQTLGDAYRQSGRLEDALNAYRRALADF